MTQQMSPIYLDYNATTPLDPEVAAAMLPFVQQHFGNPSSTHAYGVAARAAVERARAQVASVIGATPDEVIFTGGGTEATNHALKGTVFASLFGRNRFGSAWKVLFRRNAGVVTSSVEHPATAEVCAFLKRIGIPVNVVPVDRTGRVDPEEIRRALRHPTAIVSVMHANNEVGTLQPIAEIGTICRSQGVSLHTDAAQSIGKVPGNVDDLGVDLMTIAGHKLYAPKGIGALYVRRGVRLEPFMHGAGHETGRRAGTENVASIVGLGAACAIIQRSQAEATELLKTLRERLWNRLRSGLEGRILLNGHPVERLPNTLNVNFPDCVGSELLAAVPEVAASTGSACHEGKVTQSPVLCAMGIDPKIGRGAVRLSVGRFTTEDEIDRAADALIDGWKRLRTAAVS